MMCGTGLGTDYANASSLQWSWSAPVVIVELVVAVFVASTASAWPKPAAGQLIAGHMTWVDAQRERERGSEAEKSYTKMPRF